MKKIAIAAAAMGGTALIAFGASGTFAAFQDSETSTATASGGTMDLTVGGATQSGSVSPLGLNPGQTSTLSYWVNNAGTVNGALTADLTVTADEERGCQDAETKATTDQAADSSCTDWGLGGEFSQFATVQFLDSSAADAAACKSSMTGTPVLGMGAVTLKDAAAAPAGIAVGSLAANQGNCIVLKVELPPTAGNVVQSDAASFKVDVTLAQTPAL